MADIVPLFDQTREEQAWEDYRLLAAMLVDDGRLIADRQHMEALARAEKRWKQLYLGRAA